MRFIHYYLVCPSLLFVQLANELPHFSPSTRLSINVYRFLDRQVRTLTPPKQHPREPVHYLILLKASSVMQSQPSRTIFVLLHYVVRY